MQEVIDSIPKEKSIIVLANHNTGSTALCQYFSKLDPLAIDLQENRSRVKEYKHNRIIINLQPNNFHDLVSQHANLLESCFVVALYRYDKITQMADFYSYMLRDQWGKNQAARAQVPVNIDVDSIRKCCQYIIDLDNEYFNLKHVFNAELQFENIESLLRTTNRFKTPLARPSNYDDVKKQVIIFLESHNARTN